MRRWKKIAVWLIFVGVAVVAMGFWSRPKLSEAERVELEAKRDFEFIILVKQKRVRSSPRLMVELLLARTNDPVAFLDERFEGSLKRLEELGVLKKRVFYFFNTNGSPRKVNVMGMFKTNEPLGSVTGPWPNGKYEVLARPEALEAWIQLEKEQGRADGR